MMDNNYMYKRDDFFAELLNDNMVEYDSGSGVEEHIRWGVNTKLIIIKPVSYGLASSSFQHVHILELTDIGKLYAEFAAL